jgi:ribonuclease BN (tRNA processing enzyme)
VGPFAVRFCEMPHYTLTYAVDLLDGASRFTYSADCRPNDELVRFARHTDMLLIEATLPRPERTGFRGHLTPPRSRRTWPARRGAARRHHALLR